MKREKQIRNEASSLFERNDIRMWGDGFVPGDGELPKERAGNAKLPPMNLEQFGIVSWEAEACSMRFLQVSANAQELLGYRAEDLMENRISWADCVDPRDRQRATAGHEQAVLTGEQIRTFYRLVGRDGNI